MKQAKPAVRKDGARTRENILNAAAREFSEKGFAGARVDVIAEIAGGNKSLLYQYFKSKDGLFAAVLERYYETIRQGDHAVDTIDDPRQALTTIVVSTYDAWVKIPEFVSILSSENLLKATHVKRLKTVIARYRELIDVLDNILKRGAEAGIFRSGIDARQVYVTIAALTTYHWSNNHTLSALLGVNITSPAALRQRREHISDVVLRYVSKD